MNHDNLSQFTAPDPVGSEQRKASIAEVLWLTVFVMFGLFVMSRSGADPDLWGHVTYGKEVLRDGHLHETTTWSYAVNDFRWVNHENIAELMKKSYMLHCIFLSVPNFLLRILKRLWIRLESAPAARGEKKKKNVLCHFCQ